MVTATESIKNVAELLRALQTKPPAQISVTLPGFTIEPTALRVMPRPAIRRYQALPLLVDGEQLFIAVATPDDPVLQYQLNLLVEYEAVLLRADATGIAQTIRFYLGTATDPKADADDKFVIRLVDEILSNAVRLTASDVHIVPYDEYGVVALRLDGVLLPFSSFDIERYEPIIARIKILSSLDTTQHFLPQDGHLTFRYNGRDVNMRVSIIPTVRGKSVVIRVLNAHKRIRTLADVGFTDDDVALFQRMISGTGIVLVTGPTGSGKTTTIYAALDALKKRGDCIVTIEDPVEYHIAGTRQIQIAEHLGNTFARALRAVLRHDPDTIVVGEIRDAETAKIAIESALTGHLVISTLHTRTAVDVVDRLRETGIPAYLIAAALQGVVAQRLLRRVCQSCSGEGCLQCMHTGHFGRIPIYEMLPVDDEIRARIAAGHDSRTIAQYLSSINVRPMTRQAEQLITAGVTTRDELDRIAYPR